MSTAIENPKAARKLRSNREQLKSFIATHPFANGLRPLHLGALADYAMMEKFTPGQAIFREGEIKHTAEGSGPV